MESFRSVIEPKRWTWTLTHLRIRAARVAHPALMLARQWSLRRSSAAASVESGVPRVQECFRLHLNAVGSGVTIVQVRLVVVHYAGVSLSVICLPL